MEYSKATYTCSLEILVKCTKNNLYLQMEIRMSKHIGETNVYFSTLDEV